jgi:hypothetical protein
MALDIVADRLLLPSNRNLSAAIDRHRPHGFIAIAVSATVKLLLKYPVKGKASLCDLEHNRYSSL